MINGKLEISVIEGRGFESSSKKYVKFSIPSTSVKSLAKPCDKEGSVSWNASCALYLDNVPPLSSVEVGVYEESTFSNDKMIGNANVSLQELLHLGTRDVWLDMSSFGSSATGQVHCVFFLKSSQPQQGLPSQYVTSQLQQPAPANLPPYKTETSLPVIDITSSLVDSTTAGKSPTGPELLGKLEIQVVNGKDVRKTGGGFKFLSKDAFYVKMFITNNSQTGKFVKTRENEDGGTNPIWNDKLVLKVFKGDVYLTVEICQKDTVLGTGMVSLDKVLEPEKAQSMWIDVERQNVCSGSVQVIVTFKPADKISTISRANSVAAGMSEEATGESPRKHEKSPSSLLSQSSAPSPLAASDEKTSYSPPPPQPILETVPSAPIIVNTEKVAYSSPPQPIPGMLPSVPVVVSNEKSTYSPQSAPSAPPVTSYAPPPSAGYSPPPPVAAAPLAPPAGANPPSYQAYQPYPNGPPVPPTGPTAGTTTYVPYPQHQSPQGAYNPYPNQSSAQQASYSPVGPHPGQPYSPAQQTSYSPSVPYPGQPYSPQMHHPAPVPSHAHAYHSSPNGQPQMYHPPPSGQPQMYHPPPSGQPQMYQPPPNGQLQMYHPPPHGQPYPQYPPQQMPPPQQGYYPYPQPPQQGGHYRQ